MDGTSLWVIYISLLAPVGLLVVFNYIPAISALYHAFTRWDLGEESHWVGLANFRELFGDTVFIKSLSNLLKLGLFVFSVNMAVPFVVAEMIYHLKTERWRYWSRVAVVLPMIVPGVVFFMIWQFIYSDYGILTELLNSLNLKDWIHGWLSDPKTALWAIACIGFPFVSGFHVLVYYAGLTNIPASLMEAAEIDGLGAVGRIWRIHIPLILQQFKLLIVFTAMIVVNSFESIYILTGDGGPGYETTVPGLYMYLNGFTYQRMGYACSIGMLMLVGLLGFTVLLNRVIRDRS